MKEKYGWNPIYVVWSDKSYQSYRSDQFDLLDLSNLSDTKATCMILKKNIPMGGISARLSILYAPKGPLLNWRNESLRKRVLNDLQALAKKEGAIFLKIDPDIVLGTGVPSSENDVIDNDGQAMMSELKRRGWRYSSDQIQFKNTVLIDLKPSEEELLACMKQKTRYNIRLAERKGVVVKPSQDVETFHRMLRVT
ncbi:MAG TPA: peptidoglycan bridge formation glycyltransferase FemA/FemB family protein, partial [Anaerolineales bacterium]|nr:peptidoglycan bridge formation glycyltransferase FemA/FemB family protein [Anaerolineales bacterium]